QQSGSERDDSSAKKMEAFPHRRQQHSGRDVHDEIAILRLRPSGTENGPLHIKGRGREETHRHLPLCRVARENCQLHPSVHEGKTGGCLRQRHRERHRTNGAPEEETDGEACSKGLKMQFPLPHSSLCPLSLPSPPLSSLSTPIPSSREGWERFQTTCNQIAHKEES
ncbi:hypothetical protein PMAYCL1PPCAC_07644, partial [Pristionchus mayeri]